MPALKITFTFAGSDGVTHDAVLILSGDVDPGRETGLLKGAAQQRFIEKMAGVSFTIFPESFQFSAISDEEAKMIQSQEGNSAKQRRL